MSTDEDRKLRGFARIGVAALLGVSACASELPVERAYDGRVVEGRYIEPESYAAFLRGAMAEASGDAKGALAAYTEAARWDPSSPETWSRIAAVRCALDAHDPKAAAAAAKAVALDPGYTSSSPARCAVPAAAAVPPSSTRERLVALVLAARDPAAAWSTLLAWARERDDVALEALALGKLVALDPSRRDVVASAAEDLAGLGDLAAARDVAAAAVDAADVPPSDGKALLARRLALDEAIARGDVAATQARSARARIGLDEAAARALLQGQTAMAVDLAAERARSDPDDLAARMVLAAAGREGGGSGAGPHDLFAVVAAMRTGSGARVPAAVWVVFARAMLGALGSERTRVALEGVERDALVPGDEALSRAAIALALAGAVDERDLSPDGAVESTVIRGVGGPGEAPPPGPDRLDPRHRYLMLALTDPRSASTEELGARLRRIAPDDRVVAAARELVRLGSEAPIEPGAAAALLARDPADPLLAAVALRLATKLGDSPTADQARASLARYGR